MKRINKRLIQPGPPPPDPEIGVFMQGGIVFYINEAESFAYVVSLDTIKKRYGTTQPIYYYQSSGFRSSSITASESNTAAALAFFGASNDTHIFYDANNYAGGGYTDWVVPSNGLLREYANRRGEIDTAIIANGGTTRDSGGFLASDLAGDTTVNSISFVNGNNYTVGITSVNFNTKFVRKFEF